MCTGRIINVVPVYPEHATNYSKHMSTGNPMKEITILKAHSKAHNNTCGRKIIGLHRPRKTLEGSFFGSRLVESSGNIVNNRKGIFFGS